MKVTLREYQTEDVEKIRTKYREKLRSPLYVLPTGGGKCLAPGTKVLMFNGTFKKVEEIELGDKLMGPDSKSRFVLGLGAGKDKMYKIKPNKGIPFSCNGPHILSLKITNIGKERIFANGKPYRSRELVNISVENYLKTSKNFKNCAKLWRTGVDFKESKTQLFSPYFLGLWLGDGSARSLDITNIDHEIISFLKEYAPKFGLIFKEKKNKNRTSSYVIRDSKYTRNGRAGKNNQLLNFMKYYRLIQNKHIPHDFLVSSKKHRLELLAGLLDTDGHYDKKLFEITQKRHLLSTQIAFLARSLGFYVSQKIKKINGVNYYKILISGNLNLIPCLIKRKQANPRRQKKDHSLTGFKIEELGIDHYFGFQLSGDGLFLLEDLTVTHNTVVFCHIAERVVNSGKSVWILVHRKELLIQCSNHLTLLGINHGLISAGKTMTGAKVQVASVQTLVRRLTPTANQNIKPPDLIIIDECHHSSAGSWQKILDYCANSRLLGVTATPIRGDGKGLGVSSGGPFDSLVLGPTIAQLIEDGHLSPPLVFAPPIGMDLKGVKTKMGDFDKKQLSARVDKSTITGNAVNHYLRICPGAPAIAFCVSIQHAKNVAKEFQEAGISADYISGDLDGGIRDHRIRCLGDGRLKVLTSCEIVSEGTDIPIVTAAILLRPTKSTGLYLQQVGRCLRPHEKKEKAIILDHAGNCFRHGLPDEIREWTLLGAKKRDKGPALKQCPECYLAVQSWVKICPECGFDFTTSKAGGLNGGRIIEQVEGDLEAVNEEKVNKNIAEQKEKRRQVAQANTFEGLLQIAENRGYKAAWAKHVWNSRMKKQGREREMVG